MTKEELRNHFAQKWETKKEELESLTVEELKEKTLEKFRDRQTFHREMFTQEKKNMFKSKQQWEKEMHGQNAEEHFELIGLWDFALTKLEKVVSKWEREDLLLHLLEHRKGLDLRRKLLDSGMEEEDVTKLDLN